MIVVRFAMRARAEALHDVLDVLDKVATTSRELSGVIHFDVGQVPGDPSSLLALEVYEDRAAMQRQSELASVRQFVQLVDEGALEAAPEWTIYDVDYSESPTL